jgi:hypothetical protein
MRTDISNVMMFERADVLVVEQQRSAATSSSSTATNSASLARRKNRWVDDDLEDLDRIRVGGTQLGYGGANGSTPSSTVVPAAMTRRWHPAQYLSTDSKYQHRPLHPSKLDVVTPACSTQELKQGSCRFADEVLSSEYRRIEFERNIEPTLDLIYQYSRKIRGAGGTGGAGGNS